MDTTPRMSPATTRRVVELATRAPSLHNTQPWRWRGVGNTLELRADRRRQLLETDPSGRDLTISCGASLHQAEVAAAALGWAGDVSRFPDASDPDLLARVAMVPAIRPPDAAGTLEVIDKRCTDRRRFTSWPVPEDRLARLARIAAQWGTRAVPLTDVTERYRAERLVHRATEDQRLLPAMVAEQQEWRGPDDDPCAVEGSDGLIVVFDTHDGPEAWLRAGEGLSAMWLAATAGGLSVVPLSQVIEVPEVRSAFRYEVLGGLAHPLILARVGWQAIGRSELVRTPRRPLADVLDLS